jgi:hypothetical protein
VTAKLYCPLCVLPGATVTTVAEAQLLAQVHDDLHHHPLETMTITVRGRLGRSRVVRGKSEVAQTVPSGPLPPAEPK